MEKTLLQQEWENFFKEYMEKHHANSTHEEKEKAMQALYLDFIGTRVVL